MEQPKTNTEETKQKTPETQESKKEVNLSMEEVDKLLGKNLEVYDNLNSFYKTDIFKDINFEDRRVAAGKLDDKFDESAYIKAGFWQKFENFTRFGLQKKLHGLIKSKERGLLDKMEIDEDIIGRDIFVLQSNKKEKEYLENNTIDVRGDFKKEKSERFITKRYEKIDGEIVKIVESKRTDQGQIEAAVKLKDEKINEADKFGAELVKLKEQYEKHRNEKGKFENLKHLSVEGKEALTKKMAEEEESLGISIKDKELDLKERLSIFKEPLEERLNSTKELFGKVSAVFEGVKNEETEINKKLREIESEIKLIEQSGILEEIKKQKIENLMAGKSETAGNLSEIVLRKNALKAKLDILKTNEQNLGKELFKINKIGKTKEEIAEEEKNNNKQRHTKHSNKEEEERDFVFKDFDGKEYSIYEIKRLPGVKKAIDKIKIEDLALLNDYARRDAELKANNIPATAAGLDTPEQKQMYYNALSSRNWLDEIFLSYGFTKDISKKIAEKLIEEKEKEVSNFAEDWSFMSEKKKIESQYKTANDERFEETDVSYDLNDTADVFSIKGIIDNYLTKKAPQKKKDKGWFDGFIKNVFGSLLDFKKANIPINRKIIFKETDKLFKKSQKK